MSEYLYDGGPAFAASPAVGPNDQVYRPADIGCEGMSLRDWFAGQALSGVMAYYNPTVGDAHTNASADDIGRYCYKLADSLLTARIAETGKESE